MTDNKDDEIWGDDLLGRKSEAEFLENFLIGVVETRKSAGSIGSYVLNIDADWGGGKSFFRERFGKQLDESGYMVCHIDAWASDYTDDPLIPVMSAIDDTLDKLLPGGTNNNSTYKKVLKNFALFAGAVAWGAGKQVLKKHVGDSADEYFDTIDSSDGETDSVDETESIVTGQEKINAGESIRGTSVASEDNGETNENGIANAAAKGAIDASVVTFDQYAKKLIENFQKTNNSLGAFRKGLEKAITVASDCKNGKHAPFFILVDELDRCRPDYAIAMLERIKHLFEVNNIVFVLATNTTQLQHSISAVYGSKFDSQRYLHRFFDQTYTMSRPTTRSIIDLRVANSG